jgi:hypothetical protein
MKNKQEGTCEHFYNDGYLLIILKNEPRNNTPNDVTRMILTCKEKEKKH